MQRLLIYFFIAIGLSMDAFSLSLAYGTNSIGKKNIILLSFFVGIFHFIMPNIGALIGNKVLSNIITNADIIVAIVLLFLSMEMFLSRNDEKRGIINNILSIILFSFTVSIDSLSVGIALGITKVSILIPAIIFSIISSILTYVGLILGKNLYQKYNKRAIYFGIIILISTAISYLI